MAALGPAVPGRGERRGRLPRAHRADLPRSESAEPAGASPAHPSWAASISTVAFIAVLPRDGALWLDTNLIITINHEKGLRWWLAEPATKTDSRSGRLLVELGQGQSTGDPRRGQLWAQLPRHRCPPRQGQRLGPSPAQHKPLLLRERRARPAAGLASRTAGAARCRDAPAAGHGPGDQGKHLASENWSPPCLALRRPWDWLHEHPLMGSPQPRSPAACPPAPHEHPGAAGRSPQRVDGADSAGSGVWGGRCARGVRVGAGTGPGVRGLWAGARAGLRLPAPATEHESWE